MEYNDYLKTHGLKVTRGRVAILKILVKAHKSMEVESIFEECKNEGININLSTVYRALEIFEYKGIVERFTYREGIFSYKLKGSGHKHLLECSLCHKEVEVPCPMGQIEELVEDETGFKLVEHNLIMRGICKECRNKKNEKNEG